MWQKNVELNQNHGGKSMSEISQDDKNRNNIYRHFSAVKFGWIIRHLSRKRLSVFDDIDHINVEKEYESLFNENHNLEDIVVMAKKIQWDMTAEERLAFWNYLKYDYCQKCGKLTFNETCHCDNDE